MLRLVSIGAIAVLCLAASGAGAFDDALYPDWRGQWTRMGGGSWDPAKPHGQEGAPLTREYQAVLDASLADQERGGQGNDPGYRCQPHGMPRIMIAILPMEIVVTPDATYVALELFNQLRRIYTDGRDWPTHITPTSLGYSIGRWIDSNGDGRYDTLIAETRGLKGPRSYDSSGIPFHADGLTAIKERITLDRTNGNVLHNEVTTMDHALTRPWTVTRSYRRDPKAKAVWVENFCSEDNHHVVIGSENYVVNGEGYLMPVRKDQPPPDLRRFTDSGK
ncbi:MAG TPA: hypothetical protein VH684_16910 [Xanthobacteraceae bacterium]|jgi:hypothetical protein